MMSNLTLLTGHNLLPLHGGLKFGIIQLLNVHNFILKISSLLQPLENEHVKPSNFFLAASDSLFHGHQ